MPSQTRFANDIMQVIIEERRSIVEEIFLIDMCMKYNITVFRPDIESIRHTSQTMKSSDTNLRTRALVPSQKHCT